jgi:pyrroline-5-carboxylate reductase
METGSIGFIGGGRITKIILQAFSNKNTGFGKVVVTDPNDTVTAALKKVFPFIQIGDGSQAASQDVVFISLHPPVIMDTLEHLKNDFQAGATVISLAPKISLSKISLKLGHVKNVVRLIPNATSYINEGYNPVCFSAGFSKGDRDDVLKLLELMGYTFEVPEEKLESYAIMSAMLPTYFWFQWRELGEIGVKTGLTEEESKKSIFQTMTASLDLMYKSGLTPSEVIDLIPVKPIGEHEPEITEIYRSRLLALFEKIRP